MFKWVLLAAFLLSLLATAAYDFRAMRTLETRRIFVAQKRAELQTLHDINQEVRAYQTKKDAMMARLDVIIPLKRNQKAAAEAVAKLSTVDATSIESAAVIDGQSLVVNTPSGARIIK